MAKEMIIKVCGIKDPMLLKELDNLKVDYIGHIFHAKSPRNTPESNEGFLLKTNAKRVGVFVDKDFDFIQDKINRFNLSAVQLHGNESTELCSRLQSIIEVWKVFGVDEDFDFKLTEKYIPHCSTFLFDTKSPKHGGTGIQFNWEKLNEYTLDHKFILSGGIGPEDVQTLKQLKHPKLVGIDINSRFESEPGVKDLMLLEHFVKEFRTR